MKHLSKIAAILAIAFFFGALGSDPATAAPKDTVQADKVESENDQNFRFIFESLNEIRSSKGMQPIKIGFTATDVAQEWTSAFSRENSPSTNDLALDDPRMADAYAKDSFYAYVQGDTKETLLSNLTYSGLFNQAISDPAPVVVGIGVQSSTPFWGLAASVDLYSYRIVPYAAFETVDEYFSYRNKLPMVPTGLTLSGTGQISFPMAVITTPWAPGATSSYQWMNGYGPIEGANGAIYSPTQADFGTFLWVEVTQTAPGYRTNRKVSSETMVFDFPRPVALQEPNISGPRIELETLALNPGIWSPESVQLKYQWLRNDVPIPGATSLKYTLTADDAFRYVSASVEATLLGRSKKVSTEATFVMGAKEVVNIAPPNVTGSPLVGSVLKANSGKWESGAVLSYQWFADSRPVAGATSENYTVVVQDVGKDLMLSVTGSLPKRISKTVYSSATALVSLPARIKPKAVANTKEPTVAGTVKVGFELTVKTGTWTAGAALKVQWLRNGSPIAGATATSYKVTTADIGKKLSVKVTATKAGYISSSATTAATVIVLAVPKPAPAKPAPSIKTAADIVAADSKGNLWNYGNTIGKPQQLGKGWGTAKSIFVVDWNSDGTQDLLAQRKDSALVLYTGKKTGGFRAGKNIGNGWGSYTITVGKWATADRYPSILARDAQGKLWNYRNTGGNTINGRVQRGSGWNGLTFQQIDWDKDGKIDVIGRNAKGQMLLYRTNGKGAIVNEKHRVIGSGWSGLSFLTIKGYGGNGKQGVVARNSAGVLSYYGTGKSSWAKPVRMGAGWKGFNIANH